MFFWENCGVEISGRTGNVIMIGTGNVWVVSARQTQSDTSFLKEGGHRGREVLVFRQKNISKSEPSNKINDEPKIIPEGY